MSSKKKDYDHFWAEWMRLCDIRKCHTDAKESLVSYFAGVHRKVSQKLKFTDGRQLINTENGDPDHKKNFEVFENWLRFSNKKRNPDGVPRKAYLAEKAKDLKHLSTLFGLQYETFLCDWRRKEGSMCLHETKHIKNVQSLNEPVKGKDEGDEASELLDFIKNETADTAEAVFCRDIDGLARKEAEVLLCGFDKIDLCVIHHVHNRIPLNDPELQKRTGLRRSVLYSRGGKILKQIHDHLRTRFAADVKQDPRIINKLTKATLSHLGSMIGLGE